jgi:ERCC4-type nuclease
LFEKDLGGSFTKTDLKDHQIIFPKVIVDHLELAEKVEIHLKENKVTIKLSQLAG